MIYKGQKITKIDYEFKILCVGSGGTGTYFLKEFSHFLGTAPRSVQAKIKGLYVADGDVIEEKNLSRQCFTKDDIGDNKASAFCSALNDMLSDYPDCDLMWQPITSYLTSYSQLVDIFEDYYLKTAITTEDEYCSNGSGRRLIFHIPIIIGCVDNNGCRVLMEQFFDFSTNCFLFDSGNEFSTGEVVYAHKLNDKVISPVKSYYFPSLKDGDLRQVTEMSCAELNVSAPQHLATNMMAGLQLLLGMINLLEPIKKGEVDDLMKRIQKNAGYVYFDTFSHQSDFVSYKGGCS